MTQFLNAIMPSSIRWENILRLCEHVKIRLEKYGVSSSIVDAVLQIDRPVKPMRLRIDEQWEESFSKYSQARSVTFDDQLRVLVHNNSVEVLVALLSSGLAVTPDQYFLTDDAGNTVTIGPASAMFSLAFFDSPAYDNFFETRVRKRIFDSPISTRSFNNLIWEPRTAAYSHKGRKVPADLQSRAEKAVRRSLFKIAVEHHDCWSIWKPRAPRVKIANAVGPTEKLSIPSADYDENVVSYYKVAKSSPFPSQSFLSYYHVLEYYFLTISELVLHDRLTSILNDPRVKNKDIVEKAISAVRSQDARSDETELLRSVLDRFVQEADLISFIDELEKQIGEKIYTKKRNVFGEQLQIVAMKDHALANSAKVLKYIRNAIVHSSDRYKREDRHVPLSDTEDTIGEFIPLVRFFAEKVIFGTAK